jgi:Alkylated DNA repair protein
MHLAAEAESFVNPYIRYYPGFFEASAADQFFAQFISEHPWPSNSYVVEGRRFSLPRQQTWHADKGIVYSYSNNLLKTRPWTAVLTHIRFTIQQALDCRLNAVLVNLYRDGEDYVGWHSDDEAELGPEPLIVSLSFGATRKFSYKSKVGSDQGYMYLQHGDLLVMEPGFQHHWLHAVPQEQEIRQQRINLTFRYVYPRG